MDLATELKGNDLHVFLESVTWKKATLPFNHEEVKIGLVVFITAGEPIFYDASQSNERNHPSLAFCRETTTVGEVKRKLEKGCFAEPIELRLANEDFTIKKEFPNAFSITFKQYERNTLFGEWMTRSLPVLEVAKFLQCLKAGKRYYTNAFTEFREFATVEAFITNRFEKWHAQTVAEFQQARSEGSVDSGGCIIIKST